jgi:hypothetical protein
MHGPAGFSHSQTVMQKSELIVKHLDITLAPLFFKDIVRRTRWESLRIVVTFWKSSLSSADAGATLAVLSDGRLLLLLLLLPLSLLVVANTHRPGIHVNARVDSDKYAQQSRTRRTVRRRERVDRAIVIARLWVLWWVLWCCWGRTSVLLLSLVEASSMSPCRNGDTHSKKCR